MSVASPILTSPLVNSPLVNSPLVTSSLGKNGDPIEPKAHEPSMEEILLSIRRIIADDQALFASRGGLPDAPPPADAGRNGETAEPGVAAGEAPRAHAAQSTANGDGRASDAEPPRAAPDAGAPSHLLSAAANASVASSFNALVASRFVRNSEALTALTHEILRPMLKAWLDANLPPLVERLVRAEIERVARED